MSNEGENIKNLSSENKEEDKKDISDANIKKDEKKIEEAEAKKEDKGKGDAKTKAEDISDKQNNIEQEVKVENNKEVNKEKKEDKKEDAAEKNEEDGSDKNETDENDEKKGVPLLDQPLEQSGPRERKKVQRFDEDFPSEAKDSPKVEVPTGSGTQLGEIPRIDASISRFKNDDLKLLHRILFKTVGKTHMIKKNIKRFNGFDFKKDSEDYSKKLAATQKLEVKQLKSVCEMLDLQKTGTKEEITTRIIDFLLEPKDSGKTVGGGRPKRTAAVRANNRGYSSHDDSYSSDEHTATRARRDKGKRSNLKDESSSESDADFHPSDASDEKPRAKTKRTRGRKKKESEEDDASDINESGGGSSEDSDGEPKNKRKKSSNKIANNKPKGKSGAKRGRKPGSAKKSLPKKESKSKESSEEENEENNKEDEGSSSEDEPLVKKTKSAQPPTDDEIRSYVKEILDGANLEEITMKTVCKQVYAHYPDFDLAHKKDFIKSTVKSLI